MLQEPLGGQVPISTRWGGRQGRGRATATSLWALEEAGVRRRSAEVALEGGSPARTRGRTFRRKEPTDGTWGGDTLVRWGNGEPCIWLGTGAEAGMGSDPQSSPTSPGSVFSAQHLPCHVWNELWTE